jgi:hypothetical protein
MCETIQGLMLANTVEPLFNAAHVWDNSGSDDSKYCGTSV